MSFKWFESCLACGSKEFYTVLNLGNHPLPNSLPIEANAKVNKYPLGLSHCNDCKHLQLFGVPDEPMFEDYSYVNKAFSYELHQEGLVNYCKKKMPHLRFMIDVGGNNGDLARKFKINDVHASVIDPSKNLEVDRFNRGIPSITGYFNTELVNRVKHKPDLIVMCNVLPHVPDPEDMLIAASSALYCSVESRILLEFVYAKSTFELRDLGQIYHEHCSYFTLSSLKALLDNRDMSVSDIEFFPEVHGGTIRVLINPNFQPSDHCPKFYEMLQAESLSGVVDFEDLKAWGELLMDTAANLMKTLAQYPMDRTVVVYGAAAKTSTLFNMPGFRSDFIDYVVDDNPLKQNKYIPGTNIPIKSPEALAYEDNPIIIIGAHNHKADLIKRIKSLTTPQATIINYVPVVTVEELG